MLLVQGLPEKPNKWNGCPPRLRGFRLKRSLQGRPPELIPAAKHEGLKRLNFGTHLRIREFLWRQQNIGVAKSYCEEKIKNLLPLNCIWLVTISVTKWTMISSCSTAVEYSPNEQIFLRPWTWIPPFAWLFVSSSLSPFLFSSVQCPWQAPQVGASLFVRKIGSYLYKKNLVSHKKFFNSLTSGHYNLRLYSPLFLLE